MTCPRCGRENPDGAKFCLECGNALAAATTPRPHEERKVVTVLFADLVGFTSEAERLDPEEVRAILQPYHAMLREELESYGGTVEKFIGDAVMAVFGAPAAHEDDPERAIRAALGIRDSIAAEGRLHVRIGITTGEALVTLEARADAGEGMVAGDVVNTGARLQGVAPVDGILVDEATYRATVRRIEFRDHDPVVVKGKSEAIAVREVVSARSRFGVDVRQVATAPFVGRTREVDLLVGALERVKAEREPQLLTLVGVPGIGKSRLVWELFRSIDAGTDLVAWRQGRSLPYAAGVSFWALGEVVKAEAGILETDSTDEATSKLASTVAALGLDAAEADWVERHLRPLVGLAVSAELRGDRQGEAFSAWRRFLESLAEQRPLVVVFEDLHWADDGLLDLIDHVVDRVTGVPLLIVATSRPELLARRPGWGGGKPNATTISLGPLSDADAGRLVAALVEHAEMPVRLRDAVLDRAQGNPLYALEFARLLAEGGTLDDLPETVHGIIAARLDLLSRDDKELLQDAAVLGKVFWSGAVAEMRGRPRPEVDEVLHTLEKKEFVRRERRSSVADETEYAFRHILVRDVAYAQIPRGERAERHVRAAAWIESLGRAADHAELLAQHYLSAMELARAAGRPTDAYAARARVALREAGDRATALNAYGTAARHYRAALDLMTPADPDRPVVLFGYGKALRIAEESGADVLAEAEEAARSAGRIDLAAEAAVLQAELTWFAGQGEATAEHVARAGELAKELPVSPSKAYVLSGLSRHAMLASRHEDAVRLGRQAVEIAEQLGLDEIRAHALDNIGTSRTAVGDEGGFADLHAAVEIAEAVNSPELARALNNLGTSYELAGDIKRGAQYARLAHTRAVELGNASVARFTRAVIPMLDYAEGSWDAAARMLDQFIEEAEAAGGHTQESTSRLYRGRLRFARGDVDGAVEDARTSLESARRAGDPQAVVPAIAFRAALASRHEEPDADALMDEAVELAIRTSEYATIDLVLALLDRGRGADVRRLIDVMPPSPWRDLYVLLAEGQDVRAADLADELGILPTVAILRLRAAEGLARHERTDEARKQLKLAREFWRSVGAKHFLEEAERIEMDLGTGHESREAARQRHD